MQNQKNTVMLYTFSHPKVVSVSFRIVVTRLKVVKPPSGYIYMFELSCKCVDDSIYI